MGSPRVDTCALWYSCIFFQKNRVFCGGPKGVQIGQDGQNWPKWPKMTPNGQKWSKTLKISENGYSLPIARFPPILCHFLCIIRPSRTPQPHFLAIFFLKKAYFDVFTLVQASLMPSDFGLFWPILGYFSLFCAIFRVRDSRVRSVSSFWAHPILFGSPDFRDNYFQNWPILAIFGVIFGSFWAPIFLHF